MTARTHRSHSTTTWWTRGLTAAAVLALLLTVTAAPVAAQPASVYDHPVLQPIDAQNWVAQRDLTWDDYVPVPDRREEFYEPGTEGTQVTYRTAVILADFTDQPFLITQEAGSHPFGNPQAPWDPIPQDEVNDWFYDYYAIPNEFNGFNTISSYWLEDSHGRIAVDVEVFGPYTLPGKLHEYGMSGFQTDDMGTPDDPSDDITIDDLCPAGDDCDKDIRDDAAEMWRADIGCDPEADGNLCGFDNGFYVTAGHDESSTWQEFGEMLWENPEDVPAEFGPPGATEGPVLSNNGEPIPNWAPTRYIDWTSWRAAINHWPGAGGGTSTQAESSGLSVFAHEFSHLRGLPDNYNNPFADNIRNYTGYWEMMSRGTFNGPGGTHNRWQVPNQGGSALGPHHTLHFKNDLEVLTDDEQTTVTRDELASEGIAVASIQARSSVPEEGESAGFTIDFGGEVDLEQACLDQGIEEFYCPPNEFEYYRMEVVDRVGNDSFTNGHGVLINATQFGRGLDVWMIDANPQDIGMIDFYRPDGTPVPVVRGDPRQLNDATFHAGTNSGSKYEYVDEAAGLHMYILDTYRDADGVLQYDVAARSLEGAGDHERGVAVAEASTQSQRPGFIATCNFPLTNTGEAGEGVFDSDVYRLSASSSDAGWEVTLPNALAAVQAGDTVSVPVHALRTAGARDTTVTLTATSEADPSQVSESTCDLSVRDTTRSPRGGG